MTNKEETHQCKENWDKDVDIRYEKLTKNNGHGYLNKHGTQPNLRLRTKLLIKLET